MNRPLIVSLTLGLCVTVGLQAQLPAPGAPAQEQSPTPGAPAPGAPAPGAPAPGAPAPGAAAADSNQIPAEPQPQPKSQKEYEAVVAMINAAQSGNNDELIKAADNLLKEFMDSDFKVLALEMLTTAYQEKRDIPKMTVYGEMALKERPENYRVMMTMAKGIADQTKEFDLDKDEKLAKVEKMVAESLNHLKDAPRPQPQITDQQWIAAKQDYESQAWEIRGMTASAQKKYDEAISHYKKSIEMAQNPDPVVTLRLGDAYWQAQKYDECVQLMDQALASFGSNPGVSQFANNRKKLCVEAKAKAQ